jgi:hypothetical protein
MNRDESARLADRNPREISHTTDKFVPQTAGLAWPLGSSSFSSSMAEHVLAERYGTCKGATWWPRPRQARARGCRRPRDYPEFGRAQCIANVFKSVPETKDRLVSFTIS